jgi:acyl-CoA thioester hydrolase
MGVPAPSLTTRVQTRFNDLDPLGHVNNVAYVVFMETARVRFMHEYGGTLRGKVLVARTEVDHRHEIPSSTWEIDVTVQVQSVGRTSLVVGHDLYDGDTLVGQGKVVLVAVDDRHKPRPITEVERALLLGEDSA